MNVTHKELLEASDVNIQTKKQMRIYGYANLIFFLLQFTFMLLTQFKFANYGVFYVHESSLPDIPIFVDAYF